MGLWDPIGPSTLFKPHLPVTLGLTDAVTVTPDLDNPRKFLISWVTVPTAVRYLIFVSPSPSNRNKFKEVVRTQLSTEFEVPIIVPDDYVFYFWVAFENPSGNTVFLQEEPAYTTNNSAFEESTNPLSEATQRDIISFNAEMKFYAEEIRRRNLAMLENDGEEFFLFIRRMSGQPCVCKTAQSGAAGRVIPMATTSYLSLGTDFDPTKADEVEIEEAKDPEYAAPYRCPNCFGVGIAGGYFPKIRIRARYGAIPRRELSRNEQGIDLLHNFTSWTLWHPRLKERDFIVRIRSGERFLISEAGESSQRGIVLHQEFNTESAPRTAVIYQVNDAAITEALKQESAWDIGKWDWSIWA